MGRGKAPCCDKSRVKRGPWSPSEDLRLVSFIQKFGHDNWRSLPKQAGLMRCGKSCRLRWINYLRPDVKRGNLTREEADTIITLHRSMGNKWSRIAAHLPGRTDNEIKNVWNTYLKKRLPFPTNEEASSAAVSSSPSSSSCSIPFVDTTAKANASSVVGPAMVDQLVPPPSPTRDNSLKQEQDNLHQERDFSRRINRQAEEPADPGDTLFGLQGLSKEDAWEGIEMEVPLEFDHDFWEPFNNLEPIPLHADGGADARPTNWETWGVNIWREEIQYQGEKDDQGWCWLRGLERELGLGVAVEGEDHPREF